MQVFFQHNILRKLRITVISSSQCSVVSTFWVTWGNVRCKLMKPDFWGLHRNNYAFHFTFFKNVFVSFVVSLTINRNIKFHKGATVHIWFIEPWRIRATVHIWFIEPWRINGISFPIWWNSFTLCIFRSMYILTVVITTWLSFTFSLVNC